MNEEMQQSDENIVISMDTSIEVKKDVFDMNKLNNDFVSEDVVDTTMYVLNYNLNFNVKQLLQICDYYGIAKTMRQQKCNKDEIIMMLVDFEASEENSEIVKSLFDNFVKNDFSQNDNLVSDTVKHDGPSISAGILDRASGLAAVKAMRALYVEVNYSELQFYPAVDSINYKPDGNVRVYSKWTGIGKNGDTVINKYFSAFLFNADHKVIKINEFFNAGDVIKALTAEKK